MKIDIMLNPNSIHFKNFFVQFIRDDSELISNDYEVQIVWGSRNIRKGIKLCDEIIKKIKKCKNED